MEYCELAEFVKFWLSERPYLPWHVSVDDLPIDGIFLDKEKKGVGASCYFMFYENDAIAMDVSLCDRETGPYEETVAVIDAHDPEFFEKLEALLIFATPQWPPTTPDWIDEVSEEYDCEEAREDDLAWHQD